MEKAYAHKPKLASKLFETVVRHDYCVGCGACAALTTGIKMTFTGEGRYVPEAIDESKIAQAESTLGKVCPFSDDADNETEVGRRLYSGFAEYHGELGYYRRTFAGHVLEGEYRVKGSSGGFGTWLAVQLLEHGLVDAVLHIRASGETGDGPLFTYAESRSVEAVSTGAKSRYYPIEMSKVLELVKAKPGRYALVGVPCFVKASRLLGEQNPIIKERIRYFIGLVCGHLKTASFAELLALQVGVPPSELIGIDFRNKLGDRPASSYGFVAHAKRNGTLIQKGAAMSEVFGGDWGMGLFKLKSCEYCDDVFAETADVTVGDAWLPQYVKDSAGTNVVVVRNKDIAALVERAEKANKIHVEDITPDVAAQSQRAGLRHRREGLAYRLAHKLERKEWVPKKRVVASSKGVSEERKQIYIVRESLAQASHRAFVETRSTWRIAEFQSRLEPMLSDYRRIYRGGLKKRAVGMIKKIVSRLKS